MRHMRVLILLLLSLSLFAADEHPQQLVGRWRSTEVASGGISYVFEFDKDGVIDSRAAVILEGTYRLVGTDSIVLGSKEGKEQKLELEWNGDNKAKIDDEAAGKAIDISRVGRRVDSAHPLAGQWNATREWNGKTYPARGFFFADGRSVWIIDLRVDHGLWSVHGNRIVIDIENRPAIEGNYSITEKQLKLPNPRGAESLFERMDSTEELQRQ